MARVTASKQKSTRHGVIIIMEVMVMVTESWAHLIFRARNKREPALADEGGLD